MYTVGQASVDGVPLTTFADLLVARMASTELSGADIAGRLSDAGIPTTRQAVSDWCAGTYRPEPWKWDRILDILGILASDREPWMVALRSRAASPAA